MAIVDRKINELQKAPEFKTTSLLVVYDSSFPAGENGDGKTRYLEGAQLQAFVTIISGPIVTAAAQPYVEQARQQAERAGRMADNANTYSGYAAESASAALQRMAESAQNANNARYSAEAAARSAEAAEAAAALVSILADFTADDVLLDDNGQPILDDNGQEIIAPFAGPEGLAAAVKMLLPLTQRIARHAVMDDGWTN